MQSAYRPIRLALLGAGSVGSQVARLLLENGAELALRVGAPLELSGIAVRDLEAKRDTDLPQELFTTDAESLILGSDIVIELIGGIEPAKSLISLALNSGADVITANKALMAAHGPELLDLAHQLGAQLYYEAAVAGAIPIIRPLRESLAGDKVNRVMGIVNGTTNFILDRMESTGANFSDALAEATDLGYAEADPTADIEGFDAASKAAILASLAFHCEVPVESVYREGISSITAAQIETAREAGYCVKLLAICERIEQDGLSGVVARVHPTLIPLTHPLAAVRGAYNAVFVEAESAGELMFYGAGAGGPETASAVLGDLVSAAKRHIAGGPGLADSVHANLEILPVQFVTTRFQITLQVQDLPGVLAAVASVFALNDVSVETVSQSSSGKRGAALLTVMTHQALESDLERVVLKLRESDAVQNVNSVIRVEGV
ncbi:homoserine dehydrogenase [Candidatus Aquiluna sp. UB-MaderosW2red]|jgi:homoserine dehydrogenase|uniref:homoserine dehydrogenase n=1 Tax=Candidatus Aquiluna sp. UB-MaderosW2red TaxID=1855377 RepID=UPI000875DB93|nr:homoserine dehydrogenase [Candidatus Aquiluna sp. UB-MaderosW2red]SCX13940.1 homoserine dehydrogenase [Candidatus Aquiluna sp. UB-MaderosW2red]